MGVPMRRAWISLVALLALAAPAASQGASQIPPVPRGGAAIRGAIRAAEGRLDALLALARVDARLELVHAYLGYTPEQWKETRRPVTAEKILDIITDKTASTECREMAAAALASDTAKRQDPDLAVDGKGLRRARAQFSMKVVKNLDDDDVTTRGLSERVLEALWPQANEAAIIQYHPRKEKTWKPAIRAWQEHLRK